MKKEVHESKSLDHFTRSHLVCTLGPITLNKTRWCKFNLRNICRGTAKSDRNIVQPKISQLNWLLCYQDIPIFVRSFVLSRCKRVKKSDSWVWVEKLDSLKWVTHQDMWPWVDTWLSGNDLTFLFPYPLKSQPIMVLSPIRKQLKESSWRRNVNQIPTNNSSSNILSFDAFFLSYSPKYCSYRRHFSRENPTRESLTHGLGSHGFDFWNMPHQTTIFTAE